MIVTMQIKGRSIIGISFSLSDARDCFPTGTRAIDLELDHLRIRCDLNESFWRGRPEISDPRLCGWLQTKFFGKNLSSLPLSLELSKKDDCYQLHFLPAQQNASRPAFGLIV